MRDCLESGWVSSVGVYVERFEQAIAAALGVPLSATLAIGDGANDIPMIETAGLGVAYHAKPKTAAAAAARIDHGDLSALLYAQGYARGTWAAG